MQHMVGVGIAIALAALSGCAGVKSSAQQAVVVDYFGGTTALSGPASAGLGMNDTLVGIADASQELRYQPLAVRHCNAEMTACATGILDLFSRITILDVGPTSAKIRVALTYKISKEVRREAFGHSLGQAVAPGVDVLTGDGEINRVAEIPYGMVRGVEMPYGAVLTLCVSPPGTSNMAFRPCSRNLQVRDPSEVPAF